MAHEDWAPGLDNMLSEGRALLADKAAAFVIDAADPVIISVQYASVIAKQTYDGGVLGHKFYFGQQNDVMSNEGKPMHAKFKVAGDAIVLALKLNNNQPWLYGITVANLLKFIDEPPARSGDLIEEEKWLQTWKLPHEDIESLVPLVDSATHKFNDMVDRLISHLPSFKKVGIRNQKDMAAWAKKGFEKTVKKVLHENEMAERKEAKEKGARANDAKESEANGKQAKELWELKRTALMACKQFYSDKQKERIIVVECELDKQPKQAELEELKVNLQTDEFATLLLGALEVALLDYATGADASKYFKGCSPMAKLLEHAAPAPAPSPVGARSVRVRTATAARVAARAAAPAAAAPAAAALPAAADAEEEAVDTHEEDSEDDVEPLAATGGAAGGKRGRGPGPGRPKGAPNKKTKATGTRPRNSNPLTLEYNSPPPPPPPPPLP